jgi:hypothetical protein
MTAASSFASNPSGWVDRYFTDVDTLDPATILAWYVDEEPKFRFASAPPTVGKPAITAMFGEFFSTLTGMSHACTGFWSDTQSAVFEADVTFGMIGRSVKLPCASILRLDANDRIKDFRMLMDVAPLFTAI